MASKTVSDVFLKLKVEGQQTLERLRGSFRSLEKTVGVTDSGIEQLRKGLKAYTGESNNSIKVLKGQVEALKELKDQATIGGRVFKNLTEDIKLYERQLKAAEQQANRTAKAVSGKQIEARFTKLGVPGLEQQLGLRRQALQDLTPLTEAYAGALGEVLQFETALTRLQERQSVTAARARTVTFTAARGGKGLFDLEGLVEYGNVFKELPRTTAGFGQRLKELRQDFVNLDVGSDQYLSTLREIAAVQREIARGERIQELAGRDEGLIGRQGALESYIERRRGRRTRLTSRLGAEAEDYRARQDAARRAAAPVPTQVREISGLYQQIGDIGMARTKAYIDAMGNSYKQVTRDIKAATAASNGSINSLNSQRSAWTTLRNSLNPASAAYREVSSEIDKVDKKLSRLNRGGRMGRLGRNVAAGAGGMLSGGIFGGPEGAVGGLVGGLFAGPGGALAGAAAGAQLSQFRQQLSGVAEFNAEITLAKKTLAQASTGLEDYNRLLGLAREVSSDYAVSLKPAISGLAQISTAARANNLSFEDTEKIYRGLIASNVAFGKGQEDLDAIIRATVQVLSKGKVSAEELSGQIGERLPGAVAKFAAANKMTLPQLTKAFKDGEVTIAQFVRFARAQGEEYGEIAEKIAAGPEKAGIRLQIALENSGEIFGSFFAKAGAGFQDFFTEIVKFFNKNEKRVKLFVTNMINGALLVVGSIKKVIMGIVNFAKGALDILEKFNPLIKAVRLSFQKGLEDFYNKAPERMKGVADRFGIKMYTVEQLFPDQTPTSFGKGGGATAGGADGADTETDKKGKSDLARRIAAAKEVVRRLKDGLLISKQQRPLEQFIAKQAKERSDFEARFAKLRGDTKNAAIEEAYANASSLLTDKQKADLQKFLFKKMKGIGDLAMKQREQQRGLVAELQDRRYELGLITKEEYNRLLIERERARLKDAYPDLDPTKRDELADLKRREIDPTLQEGLQQNIATLKRELEELVDPINQITGAANAIGSAFSQSFASVINGSATTKEALRDFFQNIANYFLDMAAQIITKMIQMAILNTIVGLLPGGGATGGSSGTPMNMPTGIGDSYKSLLTNANGNVFNGGLKPYAMGGIVDKPTMFAYANGGTGRFGLMGEAGPEAIMPLKRGPDGRLGVEASGGGTNVVVNVDASGSKAQGDQGNASALGRAIGAAVQAELVKQKRPGGLLA